MGVIGAVAPWNYPMIMAARKLDPALAAGNSVVLKPSEKSRLTALRLAELAIEAGLPESVFNVVPGFGHESGEALALHMVLVHESIADEFVRIVASEAPMYAPGDSLSGTAQMGAIVDEVQVRAVMGFISIGSEDGARVAAGGKQVRAYSGGYFVEPTVFDGVTNQMRIAREEIFGPAMSVIRFKTEEEAVAIANDSSYGLQASVWSHNINPAHRVARALRAGTLHVNQYDEDDITVPFGGYKQSGNGRDKSLHAFDKYTELKTTWLRID